MKIFWGVVVLLGTLGWVFGAQEIMRDAYPGETPVTVYLPADRLTEQRKICAQAEKLGLNERAIVRDRMDDVVVLPCRWVKQ